MERTLFRNEGIERHTRWRNQFLWKWYRSIYSSCRFARIFYIIPTRVPSIPCLWQDGETFIQVHRRYKLYTSDLNSMLWYNTFISLYRKPHISFTTYDVKRFYNTVSKDIISIVQCALLWIAVMVFSFMHLENGTAKMPPQFSAYSCLKKCRHYEDNSHGMSSPLI